jgi:hypothetical protein
MHRTLACALLLVLFGGGVLATEAAAADGSRSSLQFAATYGYKHVDHGNDVLFESGTLRLRIYPGSDRALIGGRTYRVKDRFDRVTGQVMLSARVQRFLAGQMSSLRSAEQARLASVRQGAAPLPKLQPLPPRHIRKKRTPTSRPASEQKRAPRPRANVGGDPGWVPQGVKERDWKWIVVHHSDDLSGNMAKYDRIHRDDNKWENGCGYHFVIGNGSKSGDGQIELGPRWPAQLQGAHAKVPGNRFNERGVGICLVGDFDERGGRPTAAQMDSLVRLIRWLKARYRIQDANLHGHCECCVTRCPGRYFPWNEVRRRVR